MSLTNIITRARKWFNRTYRGVVYAEDSQPDGTMQDWIGKQYLEEGVRSIQDSGEEIRDSWVK